MSYLSELRELNPNLANFTDEQIAARLPSIDPELFGGKSHEETLQLAQQDNNFMADLGRLAWSGAKETTGQALTAIELATDSNWDIDDGLIQSARETYQNVDPALRRNVEQAGFQEESENTVSGLVGAVAKSSGSMVPYAVAQAGAIATSPLTGGASTIAAPAAVNAAVIGGGAYHSVKDQLSALSFDQLAEGDLFKSYVERASKFAQGKEALSLAKAQMIDDLARDAAVDGAWVGGLSGAVLGPALSKMFRGGQGFAKGAATGAGTESAQELVESGAESYGVENAKAIATGGEVDYNRVGRDAAFGAVLGGVSGGAVGGVAGAVMPSPTKQASEAVNRVKEDVAAEGGDPLDQAVASGDAQSKITPAAVAAEKERSAIDWSQFDAPASKRFQAEREKPGEIDTLIGIARKEGFAEDEVRLQNAKRLFAQAEQARAAGDNAAASRLSARGNEVVRDIAEPVIAERVSRFPATYSFNGELQGGDLSVAADQQAQSATIDGELSPQQVGSQQAQRLGVKLPDHLLSDQNIIYGEEPRYAAAHREQREADHFNAMYGQAGAARIAPVEGEVLPRGLVTDESRMLENHQQPQGLLESSPMPQLPSGDNVIYGQQERPERSFTPTSSIHEGVGRNIVERQAPAVAALPNKPAITQQQFIDLQQRYRKVVVIPLSKRTDEDKQAVQQFQAVQKGEVAVEAEQFSFAPSGMMVIKGDTETLVRQLRDAGVPAMPNKAGAIVSGKFADQAKAVIGQPVEAAPAVEQGEAVAEGAAATDQQVLDDTPAQFKRGQAEAMDSTDQGESVPVFAGAESNRSNDRSVLTVEAVKAATISIAKRLRLRGVKLSVVETEGLLPSSLKAQIAADGAEGQIKAAYHDKAIHIVADRMTSVADVETAVLHEAAHHGGSKLFGKDFAAAYQKLWMKLGGTKGLQAKAEEMGIADDMAPYFKTAADRLAKGEVSHRERSRYLIDEFLAHANQQKASENMPERISRAIQEFIGAMRDVLRRLGFKELPDVSDADLAFLLKKINTATKAEAGKPHFMNVTEEDEMTAFFSTLVEKVEAPAMQRAEDAPMFSRTATVDEVTDQAGGREYTDDQLAENAYDKAFRALGDKDKTVWQKAKRLLKREFKAGGLLPDSVYREKIIRDSEVNAMEFDIAHHLSSFERSIKRGYAKSYDKLSDEQKVALNDAMSSPEPDMNIPEPVRVELMKMRNAIRGLSEDYAGILREQIETLNAEGSNREAAEKAALLETILANLDTYAHRSYRAFDDPAWPKKVDRDTFDTAAQYLEKRYAESGLPETEIQERVARTIKTILEEGTAYEGMESFIKESKLGAKDLSVLKTRKQIAPEIRALLGEHQDVKINFSKTLTKMSRLVSNQRFLEKVKEIGLDEGFLFTEENKPIGDSVTRLAADGSEVYAPLNGYYTYSDIDQAFKDVLGKEQMADWYQTIVRINGMVKYGKTVLSPTTAARNWMSAFFFAMANGHFDMTHMRKSLAARREYFNSHGDQGKIDYLKKLKKLGVVYDTPYAGEMMDLLADSNLENSLFQKGPFKSLKAANEIAQKFYAYGDDFWRIIGFENEKSMLMKYKGMTEAEAEVEAAERIRNTYPTYSMTGKFVQHLRRFPLAGTFVSFPAEIIRTTYHMLNYLKKDMRESPAYARRKIAGLAIASGFAYGMQAFTKDQFDLDDDEEEAIRNMAAPWQKNSNLAFTGRDSDGNLRYVDLSFLDPYNYWKRPINAILRDQPIEEAIKQSVQESLSPFFGQDIAFGAIMEVFNNRKESGARVFNPADETLNQALDISNHLRKKLQPGAFSNIEKTMKAIRGEVSPSGKKYTINDELMALGGWRMTTFDPKTALYYRSFEFKDNKRDATGILLKSAKNPNQVSKDELTGAYETARKARMKAYQDMLKIVQAARKSGMSSSQLYRVLKRSGISSKDTMSLIRGQIPRWRPDRRTLRNTIRKAELLYGPAMMREMRKREALIIEASRAG